MPSPIFVCSDGVLSEAQLERATLQRDLVRRALEERDEYIRNHNLDPAIWNPATNRDRSQWFYRDAQTLLNGEDPRSLRMLSRQFSGRPLPTVADEPDILAFAQYRTFKAHLPEYLRIPPPELFNESGWLMDGVIVNYDTMSYWERLAALYQVGLLDRESPLCLRPGARILEIGGGYGGLAYF